MADPADKAGRRLAPDDPFLVDMPWKGVSADSSEFRQLPFPTRLYELAGGFLRAAVVLCRETGTSGQADWPTGSACYFNLHHATELFLKACISAREPGAAKTIHEVADLRGKYTELFPGEAYFFHTPWFLSANDVARVFGLDVLGGVDRKPDQLYRYAADRSGTPSQSIQFFTPGYLFNYMEYLRRRWEAVWASIETDGG